VLVKIVDLEEKHRNLLEQNDHLKVQVKALQIDVARGERKLGNARKKQEG